MPKKPVRIRKITLICAQYPPEKGAAPSRLAKMAAGFRARNVAISVVTALPNYPTGRIFPAYRGRLWRAEVLDEIPIKRYWLYPSNSTVATKRILNMLSLSITLFLSLPHLLRTRPGLIIINTPPLPVAFSAVILAKIVRARVLTNVSDIWPMSALELGAIRKGRLYALLERVERYVYRQSDAIMTQSNETRHHVLDLFPDKNTFLYRNLDYASEYLDQYPTTQVQLPKIIYAGLLGVAQGVYEICKQVDFQSARAEFHVYGDGNDRAKIEEYVAKNPGCNIYIHETVPKSEVPKILAQYHATIVPLTTSIQGAFPSKIYMAISASLPVLFCGAGEGAKFVSESGIGWVSKPGDYSELSKHINDLAKMTDDEYHSLRSRIKMLAVREYDLEDQLNRLLEFIDENI